MAAYPGKVRLVYKSYTLPFHVHGEPAARAAFAAGSQGKFWEMEHLLFERQQHLEDSDLERYAGDAQARHRQVEGRHGVGGGRDPRG